MLLIFIHISKSNILLFLLLVENNIEISVLGKKIVYIENYSKNKISPKNNFLNKKKTL